ncbi:MAG TPA: CrcB family protein [Flavobacteriales bacterium]|jgi:CrcB protein|nr:CrcB family protein [Flavobacteriales bacterium]HIB76143.1 CrcB family protein [Flavobacteriales bacterium]HIN41314.1 CrcB family protein [Flavobacteriales bacterium]HIO15350.1 CrcB family protein [Flavobacteriales bacterium]HIO60132.1 CrcB family protein [Flavobacteriales bacterium]
MTLNWITLAAIFVGGGAGSVARATLGAGINRWADGGFSVIENNIDSSLAPLGILLANVLATGLLALLLIYGGEKWGRDSIWMPLLAVGFCGGFSTFSTFSIDTLRLFQEGNSSWAFANIAVSLIACLGVGWIIFKIWAK